MQSARLKFTYRDYLLLPEGDRRELIEGDFFITPVPNIRHQVISRNLGIRLWEHVDTNGLGQVFLAPTDVVLSPESVVQPDILFVSNERRGIITEANVSGAPDLVVEILSPSTAERDRELKLTLYARYGVREYWIVDPDDETVEAMELGAEGAAGVRRYDAGTVESVLFPRLSIALDDIFPAEG
jgi:Uma2 family endonuclease